MRIGQKYIPSRLFTGLFIPEAIAKSKDISPGAKVAFGRLSRYAGDNGECFPMMKTLSSEIGVEERQAQRYVNELIEQGFIRRFAQFGKDKGQTSNRFEFIWHQVFEDHDDGVYTMSPGGDIYDTGGRLESHQGVSDQTPIRESIKRVNEDSDIPPTPSIGKTADEGPSLQEPEVIPTVWLLQELRQRVGKHISDPFRGGKSKRETRDEVNRLAEEMGMPEFRRRVDQYLESANGNFWLSTLFSRLGVQNKRGGFAAKDPDHDYGGHREDVRAHPTPRSAPTPVCNSTSVEIPEALRIWNEVMPESHRLSSWNRASKAAHLLLFEWDRNEQMRTRWREVCEAAKKRITEVPDSASWITFTWVLKEGHWWDLLERQVGSVKKTPTKKGKPSLEELLANNERVWAEREAAKKGV